MKNKKFKTISARHSLAVASVFLFVAVQAACSRDNGRTAIDEILDLFKDHDVVLFGEDHDQKRNHDFRLALLRHPKFAESVDDIVIECANSLYQELLDDYVLRLKDVSDEDLQMVWRNTTVTTGVWDSPIYEEYIRAVREVNESLRPERRIRLIAGDPPIDWEKVTIGEDYIKLRRLRDETAYTAIENEIIKKNRKGFVIYGPLHLITPRELVNPAMGLRLDMTKKGLPFGATYPQEEHNIGSYLKEKYQGRAYSIYPCGREDFLPEQQASQGVGERLVEIERITGGKEKFPYFLKLTGTEHESLPANKLFGFLSDEPVGQIMDSLLFFGSMPDEIVNPGPEVENDIPYQKELERRREIVQKALAELRKQMSQEAPLRDT